MAKNRAQSCSRGGARPAQRNDTWDKKAAGGSSSCFIHQHQSDHLSFFKGGKDTSLQTIDLTNGQKSRTLKQIIFINHLPYEVTTREDETKIIVYLEIGNG